MCIQLKRNEPVWVTDPGEPANFADLTSSDQQQIQLQIDQFILTKYDFVHYNGLSESARAWKQLMQSDDAVHLSLEGIGQMAGFSSRSSFYSAFQAEVGCSPGEFLERKKE